jgi:hypothetical protein
MGWRERRILPDPPTWTGDGQAPVSFVMGLDMYLSARKYVGNWEHCAEEEKKTYAGILKATGLTGLPAPAWAPHLHVEVCVAYWRKANAIHKWFVTHCQGGVDNCMAYPVGREQLEELCLECEKTLSARNSGRGRRMAREKLPTAGGFFFGSTDFGDDYWYSLGDTAAQIRGILDNRALDGFEFSYNSSW